MPKIEYVEMLGICKSFAGVQANKNIDFSLKAGEIVGLLGENGAGKTTLMNILYGLYHPSAGRMSINGRPMKFRSPRDAIRAGIGMIHQHFMLVQNHSVAENVVLGLDDSSFLFPQRQVVRRLEEFGRGFGLHVRPEAMVWQLSAGEQQRVEIVKTLMQGAQLLILDEPTSVLTLQETEELFKVLKNLAAQGRPAVIISHKLEEIMKVCTRVVVLRKGEVTGRAPIEKVTTRDLARMMVGRDVVFNLEHARLAAGETVLEVEDLHALGDRGQPAVRGVGFKVGRGEIFGIAGVSGNGQRELVEAVTGLRRLSSGAVRVNGRELGNTSARSAHAAGISHVPEERIKFGTVPNLFIYENAVLKRHHFRPFSSLFFLDYPAIRRHAAELVEGFQVAAPSIKQPMKNLSGGNIQKLILGRELGREPELLVASHPTYGLDVGATEYVRKQLLARRERGGAVLLVSEDLEELLELADRIAVMYNGTFMGVVERERARIEDIGLMMAGSRPDGGA